MSRPRGLQPGRSRLIHVRSDEDEVGASWPYNISRAWSDELGDVRQDLYTLADGEPLGLGSQLPR
jgi:hypothetical protein